MTRFKVFTLPYALTDIYSPELVILAYGLKELGHEVVGNVPFWELESGEHLVKASEGDYDVALVDWRFAYHCRPWVWDGRFKDRQVILFDRSAGIPLRHEWLRDGWLDRVSAILRSDAIGHEPTFPKVYPWQIGLIPEVMRALDASRGKAMKHVLWQSFRVNHNARGIIGASIERELEQRGNTAFLDRDLAIDEEGGNPMLMAATGGRFNRSYFEKLNGVAFTAAYGGYIEDCPFAYQKFHGPMLSSSPYRLWDRVKKASYRKVLGSRRTIDSKRKFIVQWDSFRLWEAMYSDTVPLLLDFDYWRLELPVLPKPMVHYLPIRSFDGASVVDMLLSVTEEERKKIAANGREWVKANYGPVSQAHRLLEIMNY